MLTPLPFQNEGIKFLTSNRNALLADDMGLGKTLQAIESCKKLNAKRVLVICPLAVRRNWCRVFASQAPHYAVKELTSTKSSVPLAEGVSVINYDIVWRRPIFQILQQARWSVVICDEAHKLKTPTAQRTRAILGKDGMCSRAVYSWMLTGTPVLNRPVEIFPMLRALRPDLLGGYKSFFAFTKRFCGGRETVFGWQANGAAHLDELAGMLKPFMLRRRKQDVLKDLPQMCYQKIYLASDRRLDELTRTEKAQYNSDNRNELLGATSSLRREIGMLKLQSAIGHLEDMLEDRDKLVVFAWHQDVVSGIMTHFGRAAVRCTGADTGPQKQLAVDKFVADRSVKLFVGNIEAAGQGIDGLQRACDMCVFVELSYVPGHITQAVSRLERMGQKNTTTAQFLVVENSLDEDIVDSLVRKTHVIGKVLDEEVTFAASTCPMCGQDVSVGKMRQIANMVVCDDCASNVECLI